MPAELVFGMRKPSEALKPYKPCSNCWICEGWSEAKFEFEVASNFEKVEKVRVHLSTDDYKPHIMKELPRVPTPPPSVHSSKSSLFSEHSTSRPRPGTSVKKRSGKY